MNNFLSFQVHGNADANDGVATNLESLLAFLTSLLSKSPEEIFSSFFPGIAALENSHPLLVHFPIAFLSSFFLLDFIACLAKKTHWRNFASGLLYLGSIMALFTVIAGFMAAKTVSHGDNVHAIMERHELFGVIVLTLATLLSLWRWKFNRSLSGEFNILHLMFSGLLFLILMLGTDLGGLMVYQYGVAVKAVPKTVSNTYDQHLHGH
jgi:uncharacterized membrane protein